MSNSRVFEMSTSSLLLYFVFKIRSGLATVMMHGILLGLEAHIASNYLVWTPTYAYKYHHHFLSFICSPLFCHDTCRANLYYSLSSKLYVIHLTKSGYIYTCNMSRYIHFYINVSHLISSGGRV